MAFDSYYDSYYPRSRDPRDAQIHRLMEHIRYMENQLLNQPPNPKSKPMSLKKLTLRQKATLKAEEKSLIRSGYISNDFELTERGTKALLEVLLDAHKSALVKHSDEYIEEAEQKEKE